MFLRAVARIGCEVARKRLKVARKVAEVARIHPALARKPKFTRQKNRQPSENGCRAYSTLIY